MLTLSLLVVVLTTSSLYHYLLSNDTSQDLLSSDYLQTSKIIRLMLLSKIPALHHLLYHKVYYHQYNFQGLRYVMIIENKSHIKIFNKSCPKIKPFGTPEKIYSHELYVFLLPVLFIRQITLN